MASVENTNRYSALEMDDDGNFIQKKAPKKQAPKEEEKPQQQQVQTEQKDRTRVSDRNRRGGRGGGNGNNGEFRGRGGRGAHRGGYIQDGEKREFDRRGAPSDRPRGRARKGGVGLGRYDGFDNQRCNRPARDETDPTVEPTQDSTTATDATATTDAAATDATATSTETPAVEETVATEPEVVEEPDTSLTLDEFQAQQRAKVVDSDVNRQLRTVEINDKQWSKISKALEGKKKFKLNAKGEEVPVEEEERVVAEKKQQKKQVLSLDEFVGSTPAQPTPARQERSDEYVPRGGRGGASGEFRGRGRGRGAGGDRGGRGRGFGRGGGRGGFRNPQVAIDDKNAFPDLSAAAKKN